MNLKWLPFMLAACAVACGKEPSLATSTSTDSAGIRIVTADIEELPLRHADDIVLTMGGVDGPGELFDDVRNPFLLDEDMLVVPDGGSSQIRLYDLEGRRIAVFGREGEGPGEFRWLAWVRPWSDDSVISWDARLRRLTVHGPGLEAVRSMALAGAGAARAVTIGGMRDESAAAVDVFADGTILVVIGEISARPGDTTSIRRDTLTYQRLASDGSLVGTVARLPSDESFVWTDGRSRSAGPLPFGATTAVATFRDGIVAADNDAFRILWYDADGSLHRISRVEVERESVDPADIAAYRERELGGLSGPFVAVRERTIAATPFPTTAPFHGAMIAGRDQVWLERYRKPEAPVAPEWIVFDSAGSPIERVQLPSGVRLTDVHGDTLVGVLRDELDVEHVVVLRMAGGR